jgi:hypothetical protein
VATAAPNINLSPVRAVDILEKTVFSPRRVMNADQPAVRSSVDAVLTLALTEGLRVRFGIDYIGAANTIYGILLVLCIHLHAARRRRRAAGDQAQARAGSDG